MKCEQYGTKMMLKNTMPKKVTEDEYMYHELAVGINRFEELASDQSDI